MGDARGQATAEYTAVLALVAAALAGAAAAAAGGLGWVPGALAAAVRTGVCIVSGDICRASDAAAAGLAPCTLSEATRGSGATLVLASLRLGGGARWTVARRSDGSVLLTRHAERAVGAAVGLGVEASPLGLEVGVEGSADYALSAGEAWELPDARAAARMLAAPDAARDPPDWRFGDAGAVLGADAGARLGGAGLTGVEVTGRAAAGARTGHGLTTLYVRARLGGPDAFAWLPDGPRRARGPTTGDLVVELTRDARGLRELALRTARPGPARDEVVETVGRLDLRDPANRAAAAPLLARRLPWPPGVARDLRAAVLRTAQAGTVERAVYAVHDASRAIDLAARVGVALGVEAERVDVERRLVAASAWTPGSRERAREDCVPAR